MKSLQEHGMVHHEYTNYPKGRHIDKNALKLFEDFIETTQAKPSEAVRCGHALNGKRCRHGGEFRTAECHVPSLDHGTMWSLPEGRRMLVHHPYEKPEAEEVAAFDAKWGTTTVVKPPETSWYFPGRTWRVEITGPDTRDFDRWEKELAS